METAGTVIPGAAMTGLIDDSSIRAREGFAMSNMTIPGEPAKRFKIYRADLQNNPVGEALGGYDTEAEVLAHKQRRDWRYVIHEQRKSVTAAELKTRIWKCPICAQTVIARPSSQPILPSGYFDNCKLKDHMVGIECVARGDLATAKRLLGEA
jgi:hypothetical protein